MTFLKTILIAGIAVYAALLAILFWAQRSLMYLPDRARVSPAEAGLPSASEITLETGDGETILAWYEPAPAGRPVLLYLHGNAGSLADRAPRLQRFSRLGFGLLAVSYRGYGGSTGSPTQAGLIADAKAAYDWLRAQGVAPQRIVLVGESLGSGVAVALAPRAPVGGVLLEAPFASAAEIAAQVYWMFPVRWLMRDPFHSQDRIADISAPLLVVHGTADPVIPFASGERLFARAREPKRLLRAEGAGHQPLDDPRIEAETARWIATLGAPPR